MANMKNLAADLVATAPSPATSGTSLVVRPGRGASFPTVPFYVTLTPQGQLSTIDNSEIVLVTAVSTDTFTITRAQKGTTAMSVAVSWVVSNAIYAEDIVQLANDLGGTFTAPTTPTAVHLTGSETITGSKTFSSATTTTFIGGTKFVSATRTVGSYSLSVTSSSTQFADTSGGNVNFNLPTAVGNNGLMFRFKKVTTDTNTMSITTTGGQTIEAAASPMNITATSRPSYTIISDNVNWWIV